MEKPANRKRRQLMLASATSAAVACVAYGWNALKSKIGVAGDSLTVNIAHLQTEKLLTIDWQNKPVWILRRSPADLESIEGHEVLLTDPQSSHSLQPDACSNARRSIRPDIFVAIGLCTHQGCAPVLQPGIGFLCPCHASRYDLAGRVFAKGPAPANLEIPPHHFESLDKLVLGIDG
jgi:ubiquinol-cytochrome c reductase iron-sulfur subunit